MNRKRKSVTSEPNSNTKKSSFDNDDENDALNDDITNVLSKADSDVEAAIRYIKKILVTGLKVKTFPPVIFVHQLYDIIHDKSVVNRQVVRTSSLFNHHLTQALHIYRFCSQERLRNQKTLVLIHLGTDEWMKIVILFEDLRNHVLQQRELAEKLLYQKFLDKVLMNTTDIGISRSDLLLKFKFSEKDIRYCHTRFFRFNDTLRDHFAFVTKFVDWSLSLTVSYKTVGAFVTKFNRSFNLANVWYKVPWPVNELSDPYE